MTPAELLGWLGVVAVGVVAGLLVRWLAMRREGQLTGGGGSSALVEGVPFGAPEPPRAAPEPGASTTAPASTTAQPAPVPFKGRRQGSASPIARAWRAYVRSLRWRGARGRQTAEYRAFMRSPAWAAQRTRVLRRDGYVCRDCHRARAREAHHTVYPPAGAPVAAFAALPDATIVAVCEPCHVRRHR